MVNSYKVTVWVKGHMPGTKLSILRLVQDENRAAYVLTFWLPSTNTVLLKGENTTAFLIKAATKNKTKCIYCKHEHP